MKNKLFLVAALVLVLFVGAAFGQIFVSGSLWKDYIYFGTSQVSLPYAGQPFMTISDTAKPQLAIWDQYNAEWNEVPTQDTTETISGTWTFTAAPVLGNDEDDTITINGPIDQKVIREDFDYMFGAQAFEEDMTAAVVTDAGENILLLPGSPLGVIAYRLEAPGGPGLADTPAPFATHGVFDTSGYVDPADNEGVEFVFGATGPDHLGVAFDEDSSGTSYAEAKITIADISDVDDLWFGFVVQEAYDDPPASSTFNTSALFVLSDNAGDLDIETNLNAGGVANDDTGTTWADAASHTLRVEISADAVAFYLDGTAVSQTNATLDLDDSDLCVVVFGYTLDAASDPGITVDNLELGVAQ